MSSNMDTNKYLTEVANEIADAIEAGEFPRFVSVDQWIRSEFDHQPEFIESIIENVYTVMRQRN